MQECAKKLYDCLNLNPLAWSFSQFVVKIALHVLYMIIRAKKLKHDGLKITVSLRTYMNIRLEQCSDTSQGQFKMVI